MLGWLMAIFGVAAATWIDCPSVVVDSTMSIRSIVSISLASAALAVIFAGAPAFASGEVSGEATIRGKDTRRNTIQLGDTTYRLDADSVMRDATGARISLRSLSVPDFGRGDADLMLGSMIARFVASSTGAQPTLIGLDLKSSSH